MTNEPTRTRTGKKIQSSNNSCDYDGCGRLLLDYLEGDSWTLTKTKTWTHAYHSHTQNHVKMKRLILPALIGAVVMLVIITVFQAAFDVHMMDTFVELDLRGMSKALEKNQNVNAATTMNSIKGIAAALIFFVLVAVGNWFKKL